MRRRLEIARALLAGPRVVFLDEPTTGLDPAIRNAIWRLIERLRREEGVTVVLSTHYLEEAEGVCDRVAVIDSGRVVADGRPAALVEQLGAELVELRVDGRPDRAAQALAATGVGSRPPLICGEVVAMPVRTGVDRLAARLGELSHDGLSVVASTIRRPTLGDVFAHVTGGAGPETGTETEDSPA